jgi:hypothetical protein
MTLQEDFINFEHKLYYLNLANKGFIWLMENNEPPDIFFGWLYYMYTQYIGLGITKLLEKNPKGKTLSQLLKEIKCGCNFKHLHEDIDNDLQQIKNILECYNLTFYRDKYFAHSDEDFAGELKGIKQLKHSDFDEVIEFIQKLFYEYKENIKLNEILILETKNGEDYAKKFEEVFKNITINYKNT